MMNDKLYFDRHLAANIIKGMRIRFGNTVSGMPFAKSNSAFYVVDSANKYLGVFHTPFEVQFSMPSRQIELYL